MFQLLTLLNNNLETLIALFVNDVINRSNSNKQV